MKAASIAVVLVLMSAAGGLAQTVQPPMAGMRPFEQEPTRAAPGMAALQSAPEFVPPNATEPHPRLALSELENLAVANNPGLVRAAARVQAARGQWVQEGLYPNPKIGYVAEEIGDEGHSGMQGGFAGQEIVTGGKLRLSRAAAAQEIREAEALLEAERYRVFNNVRLRYYDALLAQRTIDLTVELERIGDQSVKTAESQFKAKQSGLNDVLQARIESNTAQIASQNARNAHVAAWQRLAAAVGVPGLMPKPLDGDAMAERAPITSEAALGHILSTSPELRAAQARIERAEWALQRARAEPIPNVDLEASVQFDNATGYTIGGVRAGIPLPLWNRNQGGIMRAEGQFTAAQADVRQIELDLTNRLAQTYERYANARFQVERYKNRILPDAKTSLDIVIKGYQQGEFSFLILLTAQRTYISCISKRSGNCAALKWPLKVCCLRRKLPLT